MFLLIRNAILCSSRSWIFTFHYVSINTWDRRYSEHHNKSTLHSTMFLLIQDPVDGDIWVMIVFTFHYVSINTKDRYLMLWNLFALHSTMFLLIRDLLLFFLGSQVSLHSTMFLLIRLHCLHCLRINSFTFHYVSINTHADPLTVNSLRSLHSTMFLLIPLWDISILTDIQTLHSTMFLLIQSAVVTLGFWSLSLHSTMFLLILYPCLDEVLLFLTLHSTMFLLILARYFPYDEVFPLYIPLCFY